MRNITPFLFYSLLVAALLLPSCDSPDREAGPAGIPVVITVGAATRAGDDPSVSGLHGGNGIDSHIQKVRVLGYGSSDGVLAFNQVVTASVPGAAVSGTIDVVTGTFTFAFIANEDSDPLLSATVADDARIATLAKLREASFAYTAFDEAKYIPMATAVENVVVRGDNSIVTPDRTVDNATWTVSLDRLAVRLELHLEMEEYVAAAGSVLSFENVPDRVYLFPLENVSSTHTRTVDASLLTSSVASQNGRTLSWQRLILPELCLADKTSATGAVTVSLSTSTETKKAVLGFDPPADHTLPRNHYFKIDGQVKPSSVEYSVEVADWDDVSIGAIMDGQYSLGVGRSRVRFNRFGGTGLETSSRTVTIGVETDYDIQDRGFPAGLYFDVPSVSWATVAVSGSDGDLSRTLSVTPTSTNTSLQERSFEIAVRAGNTTKTILIEQDYRIADFFARSNVVLARGGALTFAEDQAGNVTIPSNVQGLHFRFGSMVGLTVNNGDESFHTDHIVFWPEELASVPSVWKYDELPLHTAFQSDTVMDEFVRYYGASGYDASLGLGDVCRYISDKGWVDGRWRIPTLEEWNLLWETRDPGATKATGTFKGTDYYGDDYGTQPFDRGWWIGNVATTSITAPPDGTLFFPAGGRRFFTTGMIIYHGTHGFASSYTTPSPTDAYHVHLHTSGFVKDWVFYRDIAVPVRCIRQ